MAVRDKTAGETVAIRDKIAGEGVAVRDKTAGESVAIRDKIAGGEAVLDKIARDEAIHDNIAGGKAILEAADRVDEFVVDPSIEAVLRPPKRVEGPGIEIDEFGRRIRRYIPEEAKKGPPGAAEVVVCSR